MSSDMSPRSSIPRAKVHRPVLGLLGVLALSLGLVVTGPAVAGHDEDIHSANARKLDREPFLAGPDSHAGGSDLAFQGRLVVAGAYEGVGFFRRVDGGNQLEQISFYNCPGSQGDVSVLG